MTIEDLPVNFQVKYLGKWELFDRFENEERKQ